MSDKKVMDLVFAQFVNSQQWVTTKCNRLIVSQKYTSCLLYYQGEDQESIVGIEYIRLRKWCQVDQVEMVSF